MVYFCRWFVENVRMLLGALDFGIYASADSGAIPVKCMICLGKWFSKLYAARTAVQIAGMVTGFPASFSG